MNHLYFTVYCITVSLCLLCCSHLCLYSLLIQWGILRLVFVIMIVTLFPGWLMPSWRPSVCGGNIRDLVSSGLSVDRQQYRFSREHVTILIKTVKSEYYVKQIEECEGDQEKLFKLVDKLLGRGQLTSLPQHSDPKSVAEIFDFFIFKIATIRMSLATLATSIDDIHCPLCW